MFGSELAAGVWGNQRCPRDPTTLEVRFFASLPPWHIYTSRNSHNTNPSSLFHGLDFGNWALLHIMWNRFEGWLWSTPDLVRIETVERLKVVALATMELHRHVLYVIYPHRHDNHLHHPFKHSTTFRAPCCNRHFCCATADHANKE